MLGESMAERIGGYIDIAEWEFEEGDISREDFIGKLGVIDNDILDAIEDDDITDEEYHSLQHELLVVMKRFGITYEESHIAVWEEPRSYSTEANEEQ